MHKLLLRFLFFTIAAFYCDYTVEAKELTINAGLFALVSEPAAISSNTPIILLLHGYGSNEKDLYELRSQLPANAIVVSARAPQAISDNGYAWYHLEFKNNGPVGDATEMLASIEKTEKFIAAIKSRYPAAKKVFLMGFSQGSIMSLGMALLHPGTVNGIVVLSGRLPEDIQQKVPAKTNYTTAIFMAHGTADKVIDISKACAAKTYLNSKGLQPEYHEYDMGHQILPAEMEDIKKWFVARLK